jgi:hypothetical protein
MQIFKEQGKWHNYAFSEKCNVLETENSIRATLGNPQVKGYIPDPPSSEMCHDCFFFMKPIWDKQLAK